MEIGIVGQGFVGTAVREGLKEHHIVHTYDKFKTESSTMNLKSLVKHSEIIFVCVPTPMDAETGVAHTGIVESVINEIDELASEVGNTPTLVIKSTVPPGTTERIHNSISYCDVTFNPEFLTEANAINDFKNQNRIIIGTPRGVDGKNVVSVFEAAFPDVPIITTRAAEAEMCKYITNTFLSVKVSFANEIYDICEATHINYNEAVELAKLDTRLGGSHWMVPGPDGSRGFGGHCFPKDLTALRYIASQADVTTSVLDATWKTNNRVREDRDWEAQEGRAVINLKKENLA
jgi:UDPglucose 6-dehydrogenase